MAPRVLAQPATKVAVTQPSIWTLPLAIFWCLIQIAICAFEFSFSLLVLLGIGLGFGFILQKCAGMKTHQEDGTLHQNMFNMIAAMDLIHTMTQLFLAIDKHYSEMPFKWRLATSVLSIFVMGMGLVVYKLVTVQLNRLLRRVCKLDGVSVTPASDTTHGSQAASSPSGKAGLEEVGLEEAEKKAANLCP